MTKRIAFRCDASQTIGTGHVMRCLTLAETLRERGAEVVFVSREEVGNLCDRIRDLGFGLMSLPAALVLDEGQDAEATCLALEAPQAFDWLVVDHYQLGEAWESAVRRVTRHILAIDDLANRRHDCDLLMDQNLQLPQRYTDLIPAEAECLLGPRFAMLRPQFSVLRGQARERKSGISRVMVFCGGADAPGGTLQALKAIRQSTLRACAIDVVIGKTNSHAAAITRLCATMDNTSLHCQIENMASLMADADLFIGTGGTSAWERCCMGLPGVVWSAAENQVEQSVALAEAGAQLYLGPGDTLDVERLAHVLDELMRQAALHSHMSSQAFRLVDGLGRVRVANAMLTCDIHLRSATLDDSERTHAWRNHPDTRRYSVNSNEIAFADHEAWLRKAIAATDQALLIAEQDDEPIGVLRYDMQQQRARVSLYVKPGISGQGWGRAILKAGERWLRQNRPEVMLIEAEVLSENLASMHVFNAAGFQPGRVLLRKELTRGSD